MQFCIQKEGELAGVRREIEGLQIVALTELILVQDWFEELKRLVPTPK
jgi:hypothetical protein